MDIVERLREETVSVCDCDCLTLLHCERGNCACVNRLRHEAADEIERLRKTLQHIAFLDHPYLGGIAKRGSLGKIAQAALGEETSFEDRWDNA